VIVLDDPVGRNLVAFKLTIEEEPVVGKSGSIRSQKALTAQ
jgi:hypothetical protein